MCRGSFQGAFGAVWALASATGSSRLLSSFQLESYRTEYPLPGPLIGGAFAASSYRWLFYMNLPLTAIFIAIVVLLMNLKTPPGSMRKKLGRMDWHFCSALSITH
jgi:hypothetical protein